MSERLRIRDVGDDELRTLSTRARRTLFRADVTYIDEISRTVLEETQHCGEKTINELIAWKERHVKATQDHVYFPAFPSDRHGERGMSLRDYFAAKAMQSLLSRTDFEFVFEAGDGSGVQWDVTWFGGDCVDRQDILAKVSYQAADAMLKARGQ